MEKKNNTLEELTKLYGDNAKDLPILSCGIELQDNELNQLFSNYMGYVLYLDDKANTYGFVDTSQDQYGKRIALKYNLENKEHVQNCYKMRDFMEKQYVK